MFRVVLVTEALDRALVVLAHRLDDATPEFARALLRGGRDAAAAGGGGHVRRANVGVAVRGSRMAGRLDAGGGELGRAVRDEPEFAAEPLAFDRLWERNAPDREVYAHARARWDRDLAEAESWLLESSRT